MVWRIVVADPASCPAPLAAVVEESEGPATWAEASAGGPSGAAPRLTVWRPARRTGGRVAESRVLWLVVDPGDGDAPDDLAAAVPRT